MHYKLAPNLRLVCLVRTSVTSPVEVLPREYRTRPTTSITAENVAAMLESIQQSQTETFGRILDRIMDHHSSSSSTPAPSPLRLCFSHCTARYSGTTVVSSLVTLSRASVAIWRVGRHIVFTANCL